MTALEFRRANDLPGESSRPGGGAEIDTAPLVGTWHSTNKATRGVGKLILSAHDGVLAVRAFGAWESSPIDWGEVRSQPFAGGVGLAEGVGFRAFYEFGFMRTLMAAYLNKRILVVDTYNVFQDDSGRFDYFLRDHFYQ
jgi:hypothetical protein